MEQNSRKKIVLVEDEETLASIMSLKLEKVGYEVKVAKNGVDGLSLIRAEKPDMVLLDIMLPGKNGLEILEELNHEGILPKLPIIVISNSGQPVEIERILKLGVRDYLVKVNFGPQEVLNKVEMVFATEARRGKLNGEWSNSSVLIVEDDIVLVDLLEKKFQSEGYRVFRATNVGEARQILANNTIGVILLDIVLPDIDGFTYLKEIKKEGMYPYIPVIIISNLGQKEEVELGLKLGAADYIIKANVLPQEIFEKAEKFFKNAPAKSKTSVQ